MPRDRLLIIEDHEDSRGKMTQALAEEYDIVLAEDSSKALDLLAKDDILVALLNLGRPAAAQGAEEIFVTLVAIKKQNPFTKVIVTAEQDNREATLKAIVLGAYDFFSKPVPVEELKVVLRRAFFMAKLNREGYDRQRPMAVDSFNHLIGGSAQMRRVLESIQESIRELENQIKRAVIMADGSKIILDELVSAYKKYEGLGLNGATEAFERELIQRAIIRSKGHITRAAAHLGVTRPTLYDLIKKLRIKIKKG